MKLNTKFKIVSYFALCLLSEAAYATEPAAATLVASYRQIDIAASRRNIVDYMAYDTPEFVTGAGNRLTRSKAANIIGTQMKYAVWFKSKTKVVQIHIQGQTAKVKTQLHQEFLLPGNLMPDGKPVKYIIENQNLDTWKCQNKRWWCVSSETVAGKAIQNGRLINSFRARLSPRGNNH